jgi:hypothetical protein
MHEEARLVIVIVRVAADVGPLVANEDRLAGVGGKAFGDRGAGEAGPDNEEIEHMGIPGLRG